MAFKTWNENEQRLYSGDWVDQTELSNKNVTCVRCFCVYNLRDAPRTIPKTDGYYVKEPQCPSCKCRLYFSN